MTKNIKIVSAVVVAGLIFGAGFFSGYEYARYLIAESIKKSFSNFGTNNGANNSTTSLPSVSSTGEIVTKNIGETVSLATVDLQINSFEKIVGNLIKNPDYPTEEVLTPAPTTQFIKVGYTLKNKLKEEKYISSYDDLFKIRDNTDTSYNKNSDATIYGLKQKEQLEVKIEPNTPYTGFLIYQVPAQSEGFYVANKSSATNITYKIILK